MAANANALSQQDCAVQVDNATCTTALNIHVLASHTFEQQVVAHAQV
jgi:hypothetical protein